MRSKSSKNTPVDAADHRGQRAGADDDDLTSVDHGIAAGDAVGRLGAGTMFDG